MGVLRRRGISPFFLVLAAVVALGAFVATGCGSKSSPASSTPDTAADTGAADTGSAASNPGLEAAKASVAEHEKLPTKVGPQEPIGKAIPTGKKIVYINCGAQSCIDTGKAMAEAAGKLGWTVSTINAAPTPEGTQQAFTEAVRRNPDAVAGMGFPKSGFQRQLAQLQAKKIPVAIGTGVDVSDPANNFLQVLPPDDLAKQTRALANQMIVDAGGKGELGVAFLTGFSGVKLYTDAWKDEIAKNCPDCTVKSIDIAPTSIGKDSGAKIANWLRANPGVGHVFLSYDDLGIGLASAVKNTGAKLPKTYGQAPTEQGMAALASGERTAATPGGGMTEVPWVMVDAFARIFAGQPIDPDLQWGDFAVWSKQSDNLPPKGQFNQVPDFKQQFLQLWGK
jgi:ribose transport system substrate-binding protein